MWKEKSHVNYWVTSQYFATIKFYLFWIFRETRYSCQSIKRELFLLVCLGGLHVSSDGFLYTTNLLFYFECYTHTEKKRFLSISTTSEINSSRTLSNTLIATQDKFSHSPFITNFWYTKFACATSATTYYHYKLFLIYVNQPVLITELALICGSFEVHWRSEIQYLDWGIF